MSTKVEEATSGNCLRSYTNTIGSWVEQAYGGIIMINSKQKNVFIKSGNVS